MKKSKKGKFLKVLAMPALLLCAGLSLTACGEPAHTHDFQTNYSCNQTHHWHDCSGCEEEKDKALHIDEDNNDFCDVCNYEMAHTHHQFANTWSSDATKHWKECACGEKSQEANHAHNTWQNNETQHWQQCECGHTTTPANHNWGTGIVTTQPQIGVPGERTFTCECGKTKTEAIPALTKPAAVINGMSEITLDKEYDGNVVLAPATLTDTNTDAGSDITFEWYQGATKLATAPKDAGTYIFKAIVAETANFARVEEGKQFTISAKEITVNWTAPANLEYSRTEKMASATAVVLCGADTATIDVTPENNNINPGPVTFTAVSQNSNYVVKTTGNANKKTYTITKKVISNIVIVKEYNGKDLITNVPLTTENGIFEGDDVKVTISGAMVFPSWDENTNDWKEVELGGSASAEFDGDNKDFYQLGDVKVKRIPKKITLTQTEFEFDYTGGTQFSYPLREISNGYERYLNIEESDPINNPVVEFYVDNPNVSAGQQNAEIYAVSKLEENKNLVSSTGWVTYEVTNADDVKITINPGICSLNLNGWDVEYNGTTTLNFEIDAGNDETLYVSADVADKNIAYDVALSNIRLTPNKALPSNYKGITASAGQEVKIVPKELRVIYYATYTGSEITIPTLTHQNSTMNGLVAGDDLEITNIQFKDTEDKINVGAPVVGGIVDYQPKQIKTGFTLAGDDCDNYNLSSGHLYVIITPIVLTNLDTELTKVYDKSGTISLELDGSNGIIPADLSKNISVTILLDNVAAGTREILSVDVNQTGYNYKVADDYAPTATITKKTLTVATARVALGGPLTATLTADHGIIAGDEVVATFTLESGQDGTIVGQKWVEQSKTVLSGADAQNYQVGGAIPSILICNVLSGKLILNVTSISFSYSGNVKTDARFDTSELVGYNSTELYITISVNPEDARVGYITSIMNTSYYMASDDLQVVINYNL